NHSKMVSQGTKLNFIILVSLCIVNFENVESEEMWYPMTVGSGVMNVRIGTIRFYLNDGLNVTVANGDCIWRVDLRPPTFSEIEMKGGFRQGLLRCRSGMTLPDSLENMSL
uniref:Uncharacterized protein n=1 Tax=Trichobilharzia regenti TaxID=157069 RepID=A0AA85KPD7_TRIRE